MYEVELKFPLTDSQPLFEQLEALGAVRRAPLAQRDRYFNHPSRDFAETDEALRIRSTTAFEFPRPDSARGHLGSNQDTTPPAARDSATRCRERYCVTYKGPIVDPQTKTRREIEVPVGSEQADVERFAELLEHLGFREVHTVCKQRQPFDLDWEDRRLELALDEVDGLGRFLEIEALADEQTKDAARDCILRLATRLGLENSERRSYLCLLLEAGRQ